MYAAFSAVAAAVVVEKRSDRVTGLEKMVVVVVEMTCYILYEQEKERKIEIQQVKTGLFSPWIVLYLPHRALVTGTHWVKFNAWRLCAILLVEQILPSRVSTFNSRRWLKIKKCLIVYRKHHDWQDIKICVIRTSGDIISNVNKKWCTCSNLWKNAVLTIQTFEISCATCKTCWHWCAKAFGHQKVAY